MLKEIGFEMFIALPVFAVVAYGIAVETGVL